eukprot:CAMPEP_0119018230 /NCGR_PEP_ID=MMETSP1176-20130426/18872_1 /TAXON_ID=265551 /ORGANISM="Synedropsis recta cf, Strain CCMP1620" /LENGTH=242 /DNA_ID=CAMNT_0006972183 /DNA_START=81 /DNA_END=812 /DNA_ORIENTATION=+
MTVLRLAAFLATFLSAESLLHGRHANQPAVRRTSSVAPLPMVASPTGSENPRRLVSYGMQAFREGKIQKSIDLFNQADEGVPDGSLRPFLWQRGISYYYKDDFSKGSEQFRYDVKVNPLDVEEIVWDIACLSRLQPDAVPPPTMMSLPKGKQDRRKIMSTVYSLFRGEANEHDLAVAGHGGNISDEFYSLYYLGLFCESRGETAKSASYMKAAVGTSYATGVGAGDYMTSCARVHCELRGWA